MLASACFYCIYHALKNAIQRDIPKHKYWVLRLVGYMQTIAFQRFYMFLLIMTHQMGLHGMYPDLTDATLEQANRVILGMFDDSFVLSVLTAFLGTEWYLAGEQGMLEAPVPVPSGGQTNPDADKDKQPNEKKPLLSHVAREGPSASD